MLKNANKNSQNSHTLKYYHNGFKILKIIKLYKILFLDIFIKIIQQKLAKTRKNSQKLNKINFIYLIVYNNKI